MINNLHSEDYLYQYKTVVSICSVIFILYWGVWMINEKKGDMMSYMRSMGMMESSNLLGYFPLFFLFSLIAAVTHELVARLIGDRSLSYFAIGVCEIICIVIMRRSPRYWRLLRFLAVV